MKPPYLSKKKKKGSVKTVKRKIREKKQQKLEIRLEIGGGLNIWWNECGLKIKSEIQKKK